MLSRIAYALIDLVSIFFMLAQNSFRIVVVFVVLVCVLCALACILFVLVNIMVVLTVDLFAIGVPLFAIEPILDVLEPITLYLVSMVSGLGMIIK